MTEHIRRITRVLYRRRQTIPDSEQKYARENYALYLLIFNTQRLYYQTFTSSFATYPSGCKEFSKNPDNSIPRTLIPLN